MRVELASLTDHQSEFVIRIVGSLGVCVARKKARAEHLEEGAHVDTVLGGELVPTLVSAIAHEGVQGTPGSWLGGEGDIDAGLSGES